MPGPVRRNGWSAPLAAAAAMVVIAVGVPSACAADVPTRAGASATAAPTAAPTAPPAAAAGSAQQAVPRPDHIVVVVEENEDASAIVGSPDAPYLTSLAGQGANFTDAHAETHPSQPNYLALFSGDQQGVTDDRCLAPISAPNLGGELLAAGKSFVGYSEDLPQAGFTGCRSGRYAQKHSPWAAFSTVPAAANQPWTAWPADFGQLPDLAMVTPNLCNDMHDCGVAAGDRWLKDNLAGYANWALTHNSWLIVTWDEASGSSPDNTIATMIVGAGIRPGPVNERIDHYSLLRTISDAFGVRPLGRSAAVDPITGIWT